MTPIDPGALARELCRAVAVAADFPQGQSPGAVVRRWSSELAEAARVEAASLPLAELVGAEHRANLAIWLLEDQARRRDAADSEIAAVKRTIDGWNQRRNDLMEAVDRRVLAAFDAIDVSGASLHSETAGMMVDRRSILSLKIAAAEAVGTAAGGALAAECAERARVLRAQRSDLEGCLATLMEDFAAGRRYFKLYRQLKAYNDARLNMALREARTGES